MIREQVLTRLGGWKRGMMPAPEEVQIYPTNNCNLKCSFCVTTTGFYRRQREVPKKRWLEVVEELHEMGIDRVLLSGGGEPLLSSATLPMMHLFKEAGIYGRMITNGTLWQGKTIRTAIEMGWDQMTFSIDGPSAAIHDSLRGVAGCFDKTIHNVRLFSELKEELGRTNPRLEINTVLNKVNYRYAAEIVKLAGQLGISHLNLEPVCDNSPKVSKMRLTERERIELTTTILPGAQGLAQDIGLSTNFSALMTVERVEHAGKMKGIILESLGSKKPLSPFEELACYEPWLWPKIEANGDVWPCSTTPLDENILMKDFKSIWEGAVFAEYRRRIMGRDLSESCQNCVVSHLHLTRELRERMRNRSDAA